MKIPISFAPIQMSFYEYIYELILSTDFKLVLAS